MFKLKRNSIILSVYIAQLFVLPVCTAMIFDPELTPPPDGGAIGGGGTSEYEVNQSANYHDIYSLKNGLCLNPLGVDGISGADVRLYRCDGLDDQKWLIKPSGEIVNKRSGLCLNPLGVNAESGADVRLYRCDGLDDQKWLVKSSGQIANKKSGLCLNPLGVNAQSGDDVRLYHCDGLDDQQWLAISSSEQENNRYNAPNYTDELLAPGFIPLDPDSVQYLPIEDGHAIKFSAKSGALIKSFAFHVNEPLSGPDVVKNLKQYTLKIRRDVGDYPGWLVDDRIPGHEGKNLLTFERFSNNDGQLDSLGANLAIYTGNVFIRSEGTYWLTFELNGSTPTQPPYMTRASQGQSNNYSSDDWKWEGDEWPFALIHGTRLYEDPNGSPIQRTEHTDHSDLDDDVSFEYYGVFPGQSDFEYMAGSSKFTMTLEEATWVNLFINSDDTDFFTEIRNSDGSIFQTSNQLSEPQRYLLSEFLPAGTYSITVFKQGDGSNGQTEFRIATNGITLVPHQSTPSMFVRPPLFKVTTDTQLNEPDGYILATYADAAMYLSHVKEAIKDYTSGVKLSLQNTWFQYLTLYNTEQNFRIEYHTPPSSDAGYLYIKYPNLFDEELLKIVPGDAKYSPLSVPGYKLANKADIFMHSDYYNRLADDFGSVRLADGYVAVSLPNEGAYIEDDSVQKQSVFIKIGY